MTKTSKSLLLTFGMLLFAGEAQAAPGDVELWNTDKLGVKVNDKLGVTFEQEFRLAEGSLHYEHTDAGLKYSLGNGFSTALRYRNVVEFDEGETDMEHRPHWNLTWKSSLANGIKLKNNVRVEYRVREGKDNNFRYRDRATVSYKLGRIGTYVSDEIFIEKGEFIRNRLYFGVDTKVGAATKVGAFYMRRTQEKDDWAATHMVGVTLAFSADLSKRAPVRPQDAMGKNSPIPSPTEALSSGDAGDAVKAETRRTESSNETP